MNILWKGGLFIINQKTLNRIQDKIARMESFFNIDTISYVKGQAEEGLYSEECLINLERILKGKKVTSELHDKVDPLNRDRRSHEEFVVDIILAWLMEDYIYDKLSSDTHASSKYWIRKNGADSKREFLEIGKIKRNSDLRLEDLKTGKLTYLEIMEDRTGFIKNAGFFNLRSGKLKFLQKETASVEIEAVHIIILDLKHNNFILYEITGDEDMEEKKHGPYGGEYATRTTIENVSAITYEQDEIGKAISKIA